MKMRFASFVIALACLSCGDSGSGDGNTSGGGSGGGSTGGSGGSSGGTGGSAGSASGGSAGYTICGGRVGDTCASNEFCDFEPNTCGTTDATGVCTLKPDGCNEIYEPACACDGMVYGNSCVGQQAGFDQSDVGGCDPPEGYLECGNLFCEIAFSYCQKTTDDTGGPPSYVCMALPEECNGQTACTCFPPETACKDLCEVSGGGFVLTCPGG